MSALDNTARQPLQVESASTEMDVPARILIVDDVADNRAILARRFERRGYSTFEADCGQAALDMIERNVFDLVLLDIMMPDIDGTTVLRKIRTKYTSAALPVIMVTARSLSDDIVEAMQYGADDYVTKPVDFAVCLARVNTQLARRKAELKVLDAARELTRTNAALEARVLERTQDLLRINEQLKGEIAQREQSEAETRFLARHDALTKLGNRVLLREKMIECTRMLEEQGRCAAVLCIDLD